MSESIQTTKDNQRMHEGWNDSVHKRIDSGEPKMKNDTIHSSDESIQCKSKSFVRRFKQKRVDSYVIGFKELWIDSSIVRDLYESIQCVMNRFSGPKMNRDAFS